MELDHALNLTKLLKNIKILLAIITSSVSFLLMGCSIGDTQSNTPALFDTKEEAEKAAKIFNCSGVHQMGDKWMPCKSHKDNKKQEGHGHHHH